MTGRDGIGGDRVRRRRGGGAVPAAILFAVLPGAFAAAAAAQLPDDPTASLATEPDPVGPPEEEVSRFYLPPLPYYQETTETTGFRMFFPLYFQTWDDDAQERSLGVLPFYWRWRGADELHETDVVLGLYWRFRRPERFTDVVGPLYVSRTADGWDAGLPPLFVAGGDPENDYQMAALWFWRFGWPEGSFVLAPPFYYYRDRRYVRWGVPPLVFGGETNGAGYSLFLPAFWHFYDDNDGSSTTVIPPLFVDIDEEGDWLAGLAPLLFFGGGEDSANFTLFPLAHWSQRAESKLLITPLGWYHDAEDSSGFGALLYHQYDEGTEWFRTVAPVWWAWGDEATGTRRDIALNVYHGTDPVSSDWVVFPFWWDFHDLGRNRFSGLFPLFLHDTSLYENRHTTWAFPTFQYSEWPQTGAEPPGWSFNLHPIAYFGASGEDHHEVVFPVWWDFESPESRTTIAFPLFWDFEDRAERSRFWTFFPLVWHDEDREGSFTLAVNTIYTTTNNDDGTEGWHFHFVPLFDVGRSRPEDIAWSVLYGLVGYERRGPYSRMKVFWIDFNL